MLAAGILQHNMRNKPATRGVATPSPSPGFSPTPSPSLVVTQLVAQGANDGRPLRHQAQRCLVRPPLQVHDQAIIVLPRPLQVDEDSVGGERAE